MTTTVDQFLAWPLRIAQVRPLFSAVLVSVVVQGSSVPTVARLLHIPMREQPPQPYAIGLRLQLPPDGLRRFTIAAGSTADGAEVRDLGLGTHTWLSLASRDGALLPLREQTRLRAGDQVLVHGDPQADLESLFSAE